LLVLLALQITLGALTVWSRRAVLPTTTHVAVGAAVLATSLMLTIRIYWLDTFTARSEPAKLQPSEAVFTRPTVSA
jgi:heme A synthase